MCFPTYQGFWDGVFLKDTFVHQKFIHMTNFEEVLFILCSHDTIRKKCQIHPIQIRFRQLM